MTESIGKLIAALAQAQAKFEPPKKNKVAKVRSEKGNYEYRYSDLADLIASVRGPLSENELAFAHRLIPSERGTIVSTILAHSSGEMLTSDYLVPNFQRQQEFGSALTYAKRYALSGLLGVAADDDDDGNIADSPVQQPRGYGNGATRSVAAPPPPEKPEHLASNGKTLPPHPEESPEATAARQRIKMLIDRMNQQIKTAPSDHALDLVMEDGRDVMAEIEKAGPAGIEAANALRARANSRIAELRGGKAA